MPRYLCILYLQGCQRPGSPTHRSCYQAQNHRDKFATLKLTPAHVGWTCTPDKVSHTRMTSGRSCDNFSATATILLKPLLRHANAPVVT